MNLWNEEAEKCAIASGLLGQSGLEAVCQALTPEDFWRPAHQRLFSELRHMWEIGKPVDVVTVGAELGKDGLREVGGVDYIAHLFDFIPSPAAAAEYAAIVKDAARRRAVIQACEETIKLAKSDAPLAEIVATAEGISLVAPANVGMKHIRDVIVSGPKKGITTGFRMLDAVISSRGFPCGQMSIVSAYHKTGKSTFKLQAVLAAIRKGRVCFATFADLGEDDIRRKLLRMMCGWGIKPDDAEQQTLYWDAVNELDGSGLFIYDASEQDDPDIETFLACLRSEHRKEPFVAVFLDYAQELHSRDRKAVSEYAEQTICASKIARLAQGMKETAVVVGSQITEGGKDGRDRTKSSRAWEEKAGWILRLKRDEGSDTTRCQSAFSRFGGSGTEILLNWDSRRECYHEHGGHLR